MAAKEQLTAMEMIWGFMSGTTGHMGKTDFAPQKEAFGDFASPETYFPRVTPESEGISSEKLTQMLRELAPAIRTCITCWSCGTDRSSANAISPHTAAASGMRRILCVRASLAWRLVF